MRDASALRSAERTVGDHAGCDERSESLEERWHPTSGAKDGLIVKWGGGVCRHTPKVQNSAALLELASERAGSLGSADRELVGSSGLASAVAEEAALYTT